MTDKWLKDIHDRMADFETDEPEGLWEGIQANLPKSASSVGKAGNHVVWLWVKRVGTVAAVIIAMVAIGLHVDTGDDAPHRSAIAGMHDEGIKSGVEYGRQQASAFGKNDKPLEGGHGKDMLIAEAVDAYNAIQSMQVQDVVDPPHVKQEKGMPSEAQRQEHAKEQTKKGKASPAKNTFYAHVGHARSNGNRLSLGVFTSGSIGSSLHGRTIGGSIVGAGADVADWKDAPILGILLFNQGKEIETHIHHKQPVRVGVTFAYDLNERTNLETGLTYTALSSDVKEGSESHYFTGEQTLHYIGVPLNMKYRLLSWDKLNVYASAGMLMEKRVSGNVKKEYVLANKTEKKETEDIKSKPIQISANIGAGVQYSITPAVGLYAEPGLSYYFDDNSSVKTIYKEKPLNLNLNLGVRFTFGK